MSNINPYLKDGMVIYKGKDHRQGYFYYVYDTSRLASGKKSICFADVAPILESLGFDIFPHWDSTLAEKGYLSVEGLHYRGPYSSVEHVQVSPIIAQLASGPIKNEFFKDLLSSD